MQVVKEVNLCLIPSHFYERTTGPARLISSTASALEQALEGKAGTAQCQQMPCVINTRVSHSR